MNENYIVINGKRAELTEEQVKALGIETEKKRKNPFERVGNDNKYYYTIVSNDLLRRVDINDKADKMLHDAINYFNDKQFANQVALHQMLYRKLLKFAYDNGFEDTSEWDGHNQHWVIRYSEDRNKFISYCQYGYKAQGVYFSSEKGTDQAIAEVVGPFMKEHPEFVW